MIKTADWIVDLGPEGGNEGGRIIAEGPPEAVARTAGSATGEYLRRTLAVGRDASSVEAPARKARRQAARRR